MTNPLRFPFTRERAEAEPAPQRAYVPLDRALLCVSCEVVFEAATSQTCPACGSRQAVALGRGALGGNRRAG